MSHPDEPPDAEISAKDQLQRAARDLWARIEELGDEHVVFMDRRLLLTRVERVESGLYRVSWEQEDGTWVTHDGVFENPREAAFHGYQGPH